VAARRLSFIVIALGANAVAGLLGDGRS